MHTRLNYLQQGWKTEMFSRPKLKTWTKRRANIDISWKNLPPREVNVLCVTSQTSQDPVLIDASKRQQSILGIDVLVANELNKSGRASPCYSYSFAGQSLTPDIYRKPTQKLTLIATSVLIGNSLLVFKCQLCASKVCLTVLQDWRYVWTRETSCPVK